jgi:hypothetical protein
MNIISKLLLALTTIIAAFDLSAADDIWPPLPAGTLSFKETERRTPTIAKIVKIDIFRGTNRIAQVQRIDRKGDGKFGEYAFSAFSGGQRVFLMDRVASTNEACSFFSCDDTMVTAGLRLQDGKPNALLVVSHEHDCYEIFTRHANGYYWPADEESRKFVDAFYRKSAKLVAPLVNALEESKASKSKTNDTH